MNKNEGIVYILTNPAMPGLVKIGMTTRPEIEQRMSELYSTGVPLPFECSFAGRVTDVKKVEKAFHKAFGPNRINTQREFFLIEDTQAIGLLEIICEEDITPQVKKELSKVDEASKDAGKAYKRKKRPPMNYIKMKIPVGSELECNYNGEKCTVQSERKVIFRNEEMSLTNATKLIMNIKHSIQPAPYWIFNGKNLIEIYNETYDSVED